MIRVSNAIQFVSILAMLALTEPTSQPINQSIDPIQCRHIVFAIHTCVNTSKLTLVFLSFFFPSILLFCLFFCHFGINPHASERVSDSHTISNVTHKRIIIIDQFHLTILVDQMHNAKYKFVSFFCCCFLCLFSLFYSLFISLLVFQFLNFEMEM